MSEIGVVQDQGAKGCGATASQARWGHDVRAKTHIEHVNVMVQVSSETLRSCHIQDNIPLDFLSLPQSEQRTEEGSVKDHCVLKRNMTHSVSTLTNKTPFASLPSFKNARFTHSDVVASLRSRCICTWSQRPAH